MQPDADRGEMGSCGEGTFKVTLTGPCIARKRIGRRVEELRVGPGQDRFVSSVAESVLEARIDPGGYHRGSPNLHSR